MIIIRLIVYDSYLPIVSSTLPWDGQSGQMSLDLVVTKGGELPTGILCHSSEKLSGSWVLRGFKQLEMDLLRVRFFQFVTILLFGLFR